MNHITVNVKDLDECIAFYEKYIGLTIDHDMRPEPPIVFLANGDCQTKLELILDPEHAYEGSSLSIGFAVDDVEVKREEFVSAGLKVTPMISPNPSVAFFFVEDPAGLMVQLIQYK